MSYIEFKGVDKSFGTNRVLKGIDLSVEKGEFVTLLGPSGCGKSTLLRCLAGLEAVSGGQVYLDGKDITNVEAKDRNIGMVFQQYSLFPNMTVEENIAFSLKLKKMNKEVIRKKVKDAIEMVELSGKEKSYPADLSGGQQQRVALARSIVMEPKVLLLDEPLSAIDAKLRKSLQQSIRKIHDELGLTSIFVTHDQDEAMVMSDVIYLFNNGKIEQSGDPVSMYTKPESKFAASFIGNYNIFHKTELQRITGETYTESEDVAIRPETVELSTQFTKREDAYQFEGVIADNSPRGNVLRYTVQVGELKIHSDALFRSKVLFENGQKVYITIMKRNCIALKEQD